MFFSLSSFSNFWDQGAQLVGWVSHCWWQSRTSYIDHPAQSLESLDSEHVPWHLSHPTGPAALSRKLLQCDLSEAPMSCEVQRLWKLILPLSSFMLSLCYRIWPAKTFREQELLRPAKLSRKHQDVGCGHLGWLCFYILRKGNNGDLDGSFASIHQNFKGGEWGKARTATSLGEEPGMSLHRLMLLDS